MAPLARAYLHGMATTTASSAPAPLSQLRSRALAAGVVLATFAAYSLWVIAGHGVLGFVTLALREPWAMQLLVDLVIACSFAIGWMAHDARKHGITLWPFVVATVLAGSIGLLGYVVWRGVRPTTAQPRRA